MLAHQGGWDEMLFVLTPMVVFAVLLWMAKRRADRELAEEEAAAGAEAGHDEPA